MDPITHILSSGFVPKNPNTSAWNLIVPKSQTARCVEKGDVIVTRSARIVGMCTSATPYGYLYRSITQYARIMHMLGAHAVSTVFKLDEDSAEPRQFFIVLSTQGLTYQRAPCKDVGGYEAEISLLGPFCEGAVPYITRFKLPSCTTLYEHFELITKD